MTVFMLYSANATLLLLVLLAVVVLTMAQHIMSDRSRARQINELFTKRGLQYLGSALPKSLPITSGSFWRPGDEVSNVVVGVLNGVETAICDFHAHRGKHGYVQTILSLKLGSVDVSSPRWSGYHLEAENIGDWTMIFKRKTKLPVAAMEPLIAESVRLAKETPEEG
jgi:hypothetical protein